MAIGRAPESPPVSLRSGFPIRYVMAILGSIGLAIIYGFKVNVSIAIIAMVNHTAIKLQKNLNNSSDAITNNSDDHADDNIQEDGPFVWDKYMQGIILAIYFGGYLVSLMPGGRMSERLSAKWVMNGAVLLNVVATLLSPISAYGHFWLFVFMRFLQGIGGGVSFPAMHVMVSKWAPPAERSILVSIIYAGTALGTVIATLLSGIIAASMSWEWVFYIEGILCLFWCTAWWIMIEDSPEEQQRFITRAEKDYILKSLNEDNDSNHQHDHHQNLPVPWGQIFKSRAFLAILIAHFCSNCGWYMMLTQLPSYMKQVLNFNLKSNATLSSLPYLCMWLFTMALSKVLTIMEQKKLISVTLSRKIGTFISSVIPLCCLLIVAFAGTDRTIAVSFMTLGVACMGGMYSGFLANHIDIAPNFAGTLVAITNSFATIPGIAVPLIVGYITKLDPSISTWRMIFFVTAAIFFVEIIVYWIFGTAKQQPWNEVQTTLEGSRDQTLPLQEKTEKNGN
ncbi:sialin [Chelonus insularis]|uniref:sialin n=1 Tax=Chelonus insularis TaxID=460826 RepID=UPI00158D9CBE|nr:sialin [Chelonus insularis]